MLNGIHFLLTYKCNYECDHCFLYCGPHSVGTFTLEQIRTVLDEAVKIGTIKWIYFEGGEPFLFYPIMVEGIKVVMSPELEEEITPLRYNIIRALINDGPLTRRELVKKLNRPRTTIYDNLFKLYKKKLIERYDSTEKKKGRPLVYWKINE